MTSKENIKGRILLTIILCIILFTGCKEKEYIYLDVNPQLEIMVKDLSGNGVVGATVKLFNSEGNFNANENPLQTEVTDQTGKVLFMELNEMIYYFYAEKGQLNNYYEVVTIAKPLRKNEIKTVSCIIR